MRNFIAAVASLASVEIISIGTRFFEVIAYLAGWSVLGLALLAYWFLHRAYLIRGKAIDHAYEIACISSFFQ